MANRPTQRHEQPRTEPEIIPPGAPLPRGESRLWRWTEQGDRARVYTARLGPVALTVLLLTVAALAAVLLLVLVGAALLSGAVLGIVIACALIGGAVRRRFRGWG